MALQSLLQKFSLCPQTILISVLSILVVFYVIKSIFGRYKNLPPGPRGLPLVGYIPFMKEDLHDVFVDMGKKYGKVFSLKLGPIYAVVIEDYEILKELFARNEFCYKPTLGPLVMLPNSMGFSLENEGLWEEQRKHSLTMMRNAGMGKSYFENEMHEEVRLVLKRIEEKKGKPCNITDDLFDSLCNIMWMLLFGYRLELNDARRSVLHKMLFLILNFLTHYMIVYSYPWTRHVIHWWKPKVYRDMLKHYEVFEKIIDKETEEKKKTLNERPPTDFTDFFLHEMAVQAKNPKTSFTTEMMKGNVMSYFLAGIMTTQTSLSWLLLTMATYPDTQQKIYEEIQSVTGNTREINWDDRKSMPFVNAVIHELQRWKTIVPLSDFRTCPRDTQLKGYDIPKDSLIFPYLWKVHRDPKLWKEPDQFKPERFLSADGKSVVKPSGYLAFTQGRRNCPGEQVAYMQIFLFFTWILQKYQVTPEKGKKVDIETEVFQFINVPVSQNICFNRRQ